MFISSKAIEFIKSFEGYSPQAYLCPAGYKTIGYGHLLREGELLEEVTQTDALELLHQDIAVAEGAVSRLTKVTLRQNQFDMLVSFVFNLGSAAYQRSSLRAKVNRNEHNLVPQEFRRWVYANGKIMPGLVKRRNLEAEIYQAG